MIITYHGSQHIKLSVGDITLGYNPVSKGAAGKVTKYGATIALSSLHDPLYNGLSELTHGGKEPFVIKGPGETETQGIFIKGVLTEAKLKKGFKINTVYSFIFDGMKVCFLGTLTQKLTGSEREQIGDVDVLFVCGSDDEHSLNPFELYNQALVLEPKIIIPIGFNEKDLPLFLKESGADKREYVEKLTIKKKDIEGKAGEVLPLMEI
jgi:hypothetical protein